MSCERSSCESVFAPARRGSSGAGNAARNCSSKKCANGPCPTSWSRPAIRSVSTTRPSDGTGSPGASSASDTRSDGYSDRAHRPASCMTPRPCVNRECSAVGNTQRALWSWLIRRRRWTHAVSRRSSSATSSAWRPAARASSGARRLVSSTYPWIGSLMRLTDANGRRRPARAPRPSLRCSTSRGYRAGPPPGRGTRTSGRARGSRARGSRAVVSFRILRHVPPSTRYWTSNERRPAVRFWSLHVGSRPRVRDRRPGAGDGHVPAHGARVVARVREHDGGPRRPVARTRDAYADVVVAGAHHQRAVRRALLPHRVQVRGRLAAPRVARHADRLAPRVVLDPVDAELVAEIGARRAVRQDALRRHARGALPGDGGEAAVAAVRDEARGGPVPVHPRQDLRLHVGRGACARDGGEDGEHRGHGERGGERHGQAAAPRRACGGGARDGGFDGVGLPWSGGLAGPRTPQVSGFSLPDDSRSRLTRRRSARPPGRASRPRRPAAPAAR